MYSSDIRGTGEDGSFGSGSKIGSLSRGLGTSSYLVWIVLGVCLLVLGPNLATASGLGGYVSEKLVSRAEVDSSYLVVGRTGVDNSILDMAMGPGVTTLPATDVYMDGGTHATLQGNLLDLNGATSADVWFEWGYSTDYGYSTSLQVAGCVGTYTAGIGGYDAGRTVYYRFCGSGEGSNYGNLESFLVGGTAAGVYRLVSILPYVFVGLAIVLVVAAVASGGGLIPSLIIAAILVIVGVVGTDIIVGVLRSMW